MKLKQGIFIAVGCLSLGLGALGTVLPILPTVPFLLLAAFCFAKSSRRLHDWFVGTGLYQKNLASYAQGRGMTWRTKAGILGTVTLLMAVGFVMMKRVPVGQTVLAIVWLCHVIYFVFGVKTIRTSEMEVGTGEQEPGP